MQIDDRLDPILPGDIRIAFSNSFEQVPQLERVLVTEISDFGATCVLASLNYGDITQRDFILDAADTNLSFSIVLHTTATCRVPVSRLSRRLGKVVPEVVEEVLSCQIGDPTGSFAYGDYLISSIDPREPHLVARIRQFRETFGLVNSAEDQAAVRNEDIRNFRESANQFVNALKTGVGLEEARENLRSAISVTEVGPRELDAFLEIVVTDSPSILTKQP